MSRDILIAGVLVMAVLLAMALDPGIARPGASARPAGDPAALPRGGVASAPRDLRGGRRRAAVRLAVLPFDPEPAARELPVDVAIRAAEHAARALHAVLVGDRDLGPVPRVHAGRAECRARALPLRPTAREADAVVHDRDVGLPVVPPAQGVQLLLDPLSHRPGPPSAAATRVGSTAVAPRRETRATGPGPHRTETARVSSNAVGPRRDTLVSA